MDGIDDVHLRMTTGNLADGTADVPEAFAEVLATVSGDKDVGTTAHLVTLGQEFGMYLFLHARLVVDDVHCHQQGVDDCVSGNEYLSVGHALAQQVLPRLIGRSKVERSDAVGHLTVHLLGPGRQHVVRAQPCFHVSYGYLHVEGSQRSGHRGRGVAVNQYHVGTEVLQHVAQAQQHTRSDVVQVLIGRHDVQVVLGHDVEHFEHLIQHLAVLGSDANTGFKSLTVALQGFHQRCHLDGFGAGTENKQYLFHGSVCFYFIFLPRRSPALSSSCP